MFKGDVGGFGAGSDISYSGYGLVKYAFSPGKEGIAGYKALYQDYKEGDFEWDVTWHGPLVGVSWTF